MTPRSLWQSGRVPVFRAFVLCLLAVAMPSIIARPVAAAAVIIVEVSAEPTEIDAESVRDAIGKELGMIAVPPADARATRWTPTLHVRIDRSRGELGVEYQDGANLITRQVPLPADRGAAIRAAAFISGNMVRNEATELLQELRKRAKSEEPKQSDESPRTEEPAPGPTGAPPSQQRVSDIAPPRRIWLGAAIQLDLMYLPGSSGVCSAGDTGYVCIDDQGSVVDQAFPGVGNEVGAGLALGKTSFVFSAELAYADHWLLGGRVGITPNQPAPLGRSLGRFLFELRATYVFGEQPLARTTVAPYVIGSLGASDFDAHLQMTVFTPAALDRVDARAFRRAGPLFLSTGIGVRVPLAPRAAIMATPVRLSLAFGSASDFVVSPETGLQVGF